MMYFLHGLSRVKRILQASLHCDNYMRVSFRQCTELTWMFHWSFPPDEHSSCDRLEFDKILCQSLR